MVTLLVLPAAASRAGATARPDSTGSRGIGLVALGDVGLLNFHVSGRSPELLGICGVIRLGIGADSALLFGELECAWGPPMEMLTTADVRNEMWAYGAGLRLRITDDYFAGVAAGRMFRGWYPRDDADDALIASELRGPYLRLFANRRLSRDSALEVSALLCPSGLGGRSAWGLELALALRFSED